MQSVKDLERNTNGLGEHTNLSKKNLVWKVITQEIGNLIIRGLD